MLGQLFVSDYTWNLISIYHPFTSLIYDDDYDGMIDKFSSIRDDSTLWESDRYIDDDVFGSRLLICIDADQKELADNIRVARVILQKFVDTIIIINRHVIAIGHKNPEYTINGILSDRKGVESENGIKASFRKAKKQGCRSVVLDFDMNLQDAELKTKKIVSGLLGRHEDFQDGSFLECYIVHRGNAVLITKDIFMMNDKEEIRLALAECIKELET